MQDDRQEQMSREELQQHLALQRICFQTWSMQVQIQCSCDNVQNIIMGTAAAWVDMQTAVLMQSFSLAWRCSVDETQMLFEASFILLAWHFEARMTCRERSTRLLSPLGRESGLATIVLHWRYQVRIAIASRESEQLREQLDAKKDGPETRPKHNLEPSMLHISRRFFEVLLDRLQEDVFGGTFTAWRQVVHAAGRDSIHNQNVQQGKDIEPFKKTSSKEHLLRLIGSCLARQHLSSCIQLLYAWHERTLMKKKVRSLELCTEEIKMQHSISASRWEHAAHTLLQTRRRTLLHVATTTWSAIVHKTRQARCNEMLKRAAQCRDRATSALLNSSSIRLSHQQRVMFQLMLWLWREKVVSSRREHALITQRSNATHLNLERKRASLETNLHSAIARRVLSCWNNEVRSGHIERVVCEARRQVKGATQQTFQNIFTSSLKRLIHADMRFAFSSWKQAVLAAGISRERCAYDSMQKGSKLIARKRRIRVVHQLVSQRDATSIQLVMVTWRVWMLTTRGAWQQEQSHKARSSVERHILLHKIFGVWIRVKHEAVVGRLIKDIGIGKLRLREKVLIVRLIDRHALLWEIFLIWQAVKRHEGQTARIHEEACVAKVKLRLDMSHRVAQLFDMQSASNDLILLESSVRLWCMWMDWRHELRQIGQHACRARECMATEWASRRSHARLCFLLAVWRGQMLDSRGVEAARKAEARLRTMFKEHVFNIVDLHIDSLVRAFFLLWSIILSWQHASRAKAVQCQSLELQHTYLKHKVQEIRCSMASRKYDEHLISALQPFFIAWYMWLSRVQSSRQMEEHGQRVFQSLQHATVMFANCRREVKLLKIWLRWKELVLVARNMHGMQQQVEHVRIRSEKHASTITSHFVRSLRYDLLQFIFFAWKESVSWERRFRCLEDNFRSKSKQCEDLEGQNLLWHNMMSRTVTHTCSIEAARLVDFMFQLWQRETTKSKQQAQDEYVGQAMHEVLQKSMATKSACQSAIVLYQVIWSWHDVLKDWHVEVLNGALRGIRERMRAVGCRAAASCYRLQLHASAETIFLMWLMLVLDAHLRKQMEQRRHDAFQLLQQMILAFDIASIRAAWMQWIALVLQARRMQSTRQLQDMREHQVHLHTQVARIAKRFISMDALTVLCMVVSAWRAETEKLHSARKQQRHCCNIASKRIALKAWRSVLDNAKTDASIKMIKSRGDCIAFSIAEVTTYCWHTCMMDAILKCVVVVWSAEVSQQVYQSLGLQLDQMKDRFHSIAHRMAARLVANRTFEIARAFFTVWHESVVAQVWSNDTVELQQQLFEEKSKFKDLALSLLERSERVHCLVCLQCMISQWRFHTLQIGFGDEIEVLKARWCDTASTTVANIMVARESSVKAAVLWAWKSFVSNEVDRVLAEDVCTLQKEAKLMNASAQAAVLSLCTALALATLLHWEHVAKQSHVHAQMRQNTMRIANRLVAVEMLSSVKDYLLIWRLLAQGTRMNKSMLSHRRQHVAKPCSTLDEWQQNALRVASRLAATQTVSIAKGSLLIWWLVVQGARVNKLKCLQRQHSLQDDSWLGFVDLKLGVGHKQLQNIVQTRSDIVATLSGVLSSAASQNGA